MAVKTDVSTGQRDILAQLLRNDTMRYSEFADRNAVIELVERGLLEEVGGARVRLTHRGMAVAAPPDSTPVKANGNGNSPASLSPAALETLTGIARGEVAHGKGVPAILDKLRRHDLIQMGATKWETTFLGRQRLVIAGVKLPDATPAPVEAESKRDTDEVPAETTSEMVPTEYEWVPVVPEVESVNDEPTSIDQPDMVMSVSDTVEVALRLVEVEQSCTACATPCLHKRVLDELMALSPSARALYEHERAKDELRARMKDV